MVHSDACSVLIYNVQVNPAFSDYFNSTHCSILTGFLPVSLRFKCFLPDSHWWGTGLIYFLMQHFLYSVVIFCHSNTLFSSSPPSNSLSQPQVITREVFWNFLWFGQSQFYLGFWISKKDNSERINCGPWCFSNDCHPSILIGRRVDSASWCQQIEFKNVYIFHLLVAFDKSLSSLSLLWLFDLLHPFRILLAFHTFVYFSQEQSREMV